MAILLCANLLSAAQDSPMKWLNSGTVEERRQKLLSLGVGREAAELATIEKDEVRWQILGGEAHDRYAVLFLPCNGMETAYLYLLKRTEKSWNVADGDGLTVTMTTAFRSKPPI
jgi:hypothetical protein